MGIFFNFWKKAFNKIRPLFVILSAAKESAFTERADSFTALRMTKSGGNFLQHSGLILLLSFFLITACTEEKQSFLQSEKVQLATPQIFIDSILFKNSAKVELNFDLEDAEIFYSINEDSFKLYNAPFELIKSSNIQIQAKKEGFINSEIITKNVIQISDKTQNATIKLSPTAHENYPGGGAESLIDLQKGTTNFREGNFWSGFQSKEVIMEMNFEKPTEIENVVLSLLADHRSWIFLPEKIQVFSEGNLVGERVLKTPKKEEKASLEFITTSIKKDNYSKFEIHILSEKGIPEWHAGKGTQGWLFIDEVLL